MYIMKTYMHIYTHMTIPTCLKHLISNGQFGSSVWTEAFLAPAPGLMQPFWLKRLVYIYTYIYVCHCMPLHATAMQLHATAYATACHCMPLHATACHWMPLHATSCHCMPLHATACHCGMPACHCMPLHATACHCTPRPCHCMPLHANACHCMTLHATGWHLEFPIPNLDVPWK